jgi:hypothetical protein
MGMTRIRYAGETQGRSLEVDTIHTWNRGDVEPVSGGSGLKDYVKNRVWQVFQDEPDVDRVVMVRANGPAFFLLRRLGYWFDVTGKQITSSADDLRKEGAA